jgi:ATP-dependent helicase/DNAse subunit B
MAEHIRNQLAREGFTFPAACVMTFGRFVSGLTQAVNSVPRGALEIFVEQALAYQRLQEFEAVAALPGFKRSICGVCEELASAGCGSERLRQLLNLFDPPEPRGHAIARIYSELERLLERRGLSMRSESLASAAAHVRVFGAGDLHSIYLDGFFQFTHPELDFIGALASAACCTVTLPSWTGAQPSRERLESIGFAVDEKRQAFRFPESTLVAAPTVERECDEIAHRILKMAEQGRPCREIGIIVRSEQPYVPVVRASLERFGIPARFYFSEPLALHPVVRFFEAAIEAMLSGWNHAKTLEAITSSVSGLAGKTAAFEFEFAIREQLPGSGLEALKRLHPGVRSIESLIRLFEQIDAFGTDSAFPSVWAERVANLRSFFRGPSSTEPLDLESVEKWRHQSAALNEFEHATEEVLLALDPETRIPFAQFWSALKTILATSEIRIQDRRRNVVHVMDVYEARQWQLPVTFVCGLVEKQFPRYRQRPIVLSDETRWRLQRFGVNLRTTADWTQEEDFLFDLATSRASENLILSYPEQSASGDPLLRSFALDRFLERQAERLPIQPAGSVRPEPRTKPPRAHAGKISDTALLDVIGARHRALSPTAIESFLQCPFQFYARKTLKLRARPERPQDRLSSLVQGGIIHAVLSRIDGPGTLEEIFHQTYALSEAENRILPGYRTETIKLEMLRVLRMFRDKGILPLSWTPANEVVFDFEIQPDLRLRGRMDRLLVDSDGRALVIDFKYSSKSNVEKCVNEHDQGLRGHTPAGMLYTGLRKEISWRGWHASIPKLTEFGLEGRTESGLREVIDQALAQAISAAARIRSGVIAPAPAVADKCRYCDFADICRVETPIVLTATGGNVFYDVE